MSSQRYSWEENENERWEGKEESFLLLNYPITWKKLNHMVPWAKEIKASGSSMEGSLLGEEEGNENESILELVHIYERFVWVIWLSNFSLFTPQILLNLPTPFSWPKTHSLKCKHYNLIKRHIQ